MSNQIVNDAVARGVLWVNSSGNYAQQHWSGPWSNSVGVGLQTISVQSGSTVQVALRWNDTWGGSCNDYDLGLFNPSGTLVASSLSVQNCSGSSRPVERITYAAPTSGTYQIVVSQFSASGSQTLDLIATNNLPSPVASKSLAHPADNANPGMLSVGAVDWLFPTAIEPYSS